MTHLRPRYFRRILILIALIFIGRYAVEHAIETYKKNRVADTRSINDPHDRDKKSLLYAFVAIGTSPQRQKVIYDNVQVISKPSSRYNVDCILFSYAAYQDEPAWVKQIDNDKTHICQVIRVYKLGFVEFLKMLMPRMLKKARYDYLTIVLDDVTLAPPHGNYNYERFFDLVQKFDLSVATPSVINSLHHVLRPLKTLLPNQIGRKMKMIEIQAITFHLKAWECFYELVDAQYPSGWGMDVWYFDYCVNTGRVDDKIGVIDIIHVTHNPFMSNTTNRPGIDLIEYYINQQKDWLKYRGVLLKEEWGMFSLIFLLILKAENQEEH